MEDKDELLKPCPFCGNKHIILNYHPIEAYCTKPYCHGNYSKPYPNIEEAIKAWNTRTPNQTTNKEN